MLNKSTKEIEPLAYPIEDNRESSRDRVLRDLRAANAQLEKMNRYKSQFLANMSHELRTPLHAIIGFSELLHDEIHAANLAPKQRAYAGHILESGRHLLALVNDVLDLSRVEAGRIELRCKWVSPRDLAHRAAAIVHPLAVKQGVTLDIERICRGYFRNTNDSARTTNAKARASGWRSRRSSWSCMADRST